MHHCKPVKEWVKERKNQIDLFCLPSYSPELNLEERLNANPKHAIGSKWPAHTKAKLRNVAVNRMSEIKQSPERVKAFFQDPRFFYANNVLIRAGSIGSRPYHSVSNRVRSSKGG